MSSLTPSTFRSSVPDSYALWTDSCHYARTCAAELSLIVTVLVLLMQPS